MNEKQEKLTVIQAAIISAYTGVMVGKFTDMRDYACELLGRELFTHDFGERAIRDELKARSKPDFLALQP